MKNIFLAVIAVVGVVTPTVVLADDGSCGDFRKVTGTELIMCADLAKGPTSQEARAARKLIETGNAHGSLKGVTAHA
jgi:hypothetical protein